MWCRNCQQDVPALVGMTGGPACPRCRSRLRGATADSGVELGSFDRERQPIAGNPAPWALEASAAELRRIGRRLRPCQATLPACEASHGWTPHEIAEPAPRPLHGLRKPEARSAPGGVGATLAVATGLIATTAGAAAAGAQLAGFVAAELWRAGMAVAIVGQGLVALGLLRLAAGAWRNGRRLQRDMASLEGQLAELREATAVRPPAPMRRIAWEAPPRVAALGARGLDPSHPVSSHAVSSRVA
jgi:hypothetical protein